MKLKNKKTGEIGLLIYTSDIDGSFIIQDPNATSNCEYIAKYDSLAELNSEWEDVPEEPKGYWYVDDAGVIQIDQVLCSEINMRKSIGNYYDTKEEAEKACEKLKAYKRLKDKGFRFDEWVNVSAGPYSPVWFYFRKDTKLEDVKADLDLLFGGGE